MGLLTLIAAQPAFAATLFSIDGASPNVPAVSPDDVLAPGPLGGPPAVVASPCLAPTGLFGADELDALTCGVVDLTLAFSVDRLSAGVPGAAPDVASEAGAGQAAGDVFLTGLGGSNSLFLNQDGLGELPALPAGVPALPPIDNLDALDLVQTDVEAFSLAPGNSFGVSGADILIPGPGLLLPAAALGLAVADDIDALQAVPVGEAAGFLFSLAPGSPALGLVSAGCPAPPCSAADVFFSSGSGSFSLFAPASALGLLTGDNVDALAMVPEPGSGLLLGAGLLGTALLRRRP